MSILPGNVWVWIHQDTDETEEETVFPFHKLLLQEISRQYIIKLNQEKSSVNLQTAVRAISDAA